jgi:hypothetical protein
MRRYFFNTASMKHWQKRKSLHIIDEVPGTKIYPAEGRSMASLAHLKVSSANF